VGSDFTNANFIGADLRGARLHRCVLRDADFYWANLTECELVDCDTAGARFPEPVRVAYGPKGVAPRPIVPVPLYRAAATDEECRQMLSSCLNADPKMRGTRQ
jgi:uncharacterized protein YjbI with pentapeptide repeats